MKKEADEKEGRGKFTDLSSSTEDAEREDPWGVEDTQKFKAAEEVPPPTAESRTEENIRLLELPRPHAPRIDPPPETEPVPKPKRTSVGIRRRPEYEEGPSIPEAPKSPVSVGTQLLNCGEAGPRRKSSKKTVEQSGGDALHDAVFGGCQDERGRVPQPNDWNAEEPRSDARGQEK